MTVKALAEIEVFESVVLPEPKREIEGVYIGDLLSWVMGRASASQIWITIMSNVNILAVAALADVSCIIIAEGVKLEKEVIDTAKEKGINIISTDMTMYDTAVFLNSVL